MRAYPRIAQFMAALILIASMLVSCAPAPAQPAAPAPAATQAPAAAQPTQQPAAGQTAGEPVTITWLQWWVNEWGPDVHGKLISDFEAAHPNIKVKVVDVPWDDMAGKLQAAAAGGSESYDVMGIENEWIASMMKQGYIESLDDRLAADKAFADSLSPVTPMKFLGKTDALCLYLIPYQLAYNVDMLEEKGLKPPTNWEEFTDVATNLVDKEKNNYALTLALQDGSYIMTRLFGYRLAQEGGQYLDAEGNVAFNSPEGVAAMQWWKDFYAKDVVVPGALSQGQSAALEFLASERVGIMFDGPFVLTKTKKLNPNVNLAYAPAWKSKTGGNSWACSGVALGAKSQHKEEAWEFIKYLYSEDVALKMTKTVSLPWATKAALASLEGSDDPVLKVIPSLANQDSEHNVLHPILPNMEKASDAFKQAFQEAITGQKEIQIALDEAAAVWQADIDAAKGQ